MTAPDSFSEYSYDHRWREPSLPPRQHDPGGCFDNLWWYKFTRRAQRSAVRVPIATERADGFVLPDWNPQ